MTLRNAAILAADVVGYTRLISDAEEQTLHLLTDLQAMFWDTITRFKGRAFNTAGDAIRAEFPSTADAVNAALALQQTLLARNAGYPLARQMMYRIGIAAGEVVDQDGDVHGTPVTLATALEALAAPGGLCISKAVHDEVAVTHSGRFADMGVVRTQAAPEGVHAFTLILDQAARGAAPPLQPIKAPNPPANNVGQMTWAATAAAGIVAVAGLAWFMQPNIVKEGIASQPSQSAAVAPKPAVAETKPASADSPAAAVVKPAPPVKSEAPPAIKAASPDTPGPSSVPVATPVGFGTDWLAIEAQRTRQISQCAGEDLSLAITACRALLQSPSLPSSLIAETQTNLGSALRQTGKTDEAIEALTAAIKIAPDATAYNHRGLAYFEKGKMDAAIDDFSAAIKLKPENGDALNNRAWTQFKAGRLNLAEKDAKLATTYSSGAAYVWDTSGHINEALGRKQVAIDNFRRALSIDPKQEASRSALARLEGKP